MIMIKKSHMLQGKNRCLEAELQGIRKVFKALCPDLTFFSDFFSLFLIGLPFFFFLRFLGFEKLKTQKKITTEFGEFFWIF